MKKQFFCCLFALAITGTSLKAQQIVAASSQTSEKKQPNALTKVALLKLSATGTPNEELSKAYPVFFEYYSVKERVDAQIALGDNKSAASEEYAKLILNRDEKLKTILSEKEMKVFKSKLEAELAIEENK
jgi:hypothetical protein